VDHGIEPPAVRAARGKSPTGTILLTAAQESNQVVITLVDDGGGIDAAEVRRRALERGIVRADEALTDREAIQLIFTEGFSTARTITDVSGRGVGLDVVVRSMEQLNGLIEAETVSGAGTKFTLQLPLTLAIITVLMAERSTPSPRGRWSRACATRRARSPGSAAVTRCACATASCRSSTSPSCSG
jgi:two-component system chemotaxis sensor kinase CheA